MFVDFFLNFWFLLNTISLYIVFGLIISVILKYILHDNFIINQISTNTAYCIFKASVIGIFYPLCSFGMPSFISFLRDKDIHRSVILSFTISAIISSISFILVLYSVFNLSFILYGLFISFFLANIGGYIIFLLSIKQINNKFNDIKNSSRFIQKINLIKKNSIKKTTLLDSINFVLNGIVKNISKPIIFSLILSSFIMIFKNEINAVMFETTFLNYLLIASIAIVVHICSIGSAIIAISMIGIGFTPGTILLFLIMAPATSQDILTILYKELGLKSLMVYIITITIGSFVSAAIYDNYLISYWSVSMSPISIFNILATLIFIAIIIKMIFTKYKINFK